MTIISPATGDFNELHPLAIIAYPDLIRGWLWEPILGRDLKELNQCLRDTGGAVDWDRVSYERPQFNPALRQRLPLLRPAPEVITLLLRMRGNAFYITRGEAAIDWEFPPDEVERAGTAIRRHVLWPRHRRSILIYKNSMYVNPRSSARNIALYHDKLSRKTNRPCVHCCYRMQSNAMLVRHRLARLDDWLHLNYHSFFAPILQFADLDYGRLGHLLRNRLARRKGRSGGRSQSHQITDRSEGLWHFEQHARVKELLEDGTTRYSDYLSIQQYLDQYRNYVNVASCIVDLDNSYLLPRRPERHGISPLPHFPSHLRPFHRDNLTPPLPSFV